MAEKVEDSQQSFAGRADSSMNPAFMRGDQYLWGVNVTTRGGTPRTRPGLATRFNFPCEHPQGFTMFQPTGGVVHMVVVVDGEVFVSPSPFETYTKLEGVQFYNKSRFVAFAECLQSTTFDDEGFFRPLAIPKKVLVMQDGNTRAAFWDGGTARHLDPTPSMVFDEDSGERITQPRKDETKIGLWMAWAGNRLWVSRGPNVWASDIGNPLKFTEAQYIAEGRSFTMPENVTGMIQPSSGQPLVVFGEKTITFLRADILDRSKWLDTPDFQQSEHGIGCVAPRSIINKLGLVWWYSPSGWTNLNFAMQSFNDSRVRYFDKPMDWSKRNLSIDKTAICAGEIEDYTLISTPSGDRWNRHTWVYDDWQDNPGWDGVWMGVRPVQWAKAVIDGTERIFCLSADEDGVNRVWEAMQSRRADNGEPISSFLATRYYNFGGGLNKRFSHSELFLREVEGDTELTVWAQSPRGAADKSTNILFKPERAFFKSQLLTEDTVIETRSPQFREPKGRQTNIGWVNPCGECTVETGSTKRSPMVDKSFGLVLAWSGVMAVDAFRIYAYMGDDNKLEGECSKDDEEEVSVRSNGCSNEPGEEEPFRFFFSEQEETVGCPQSGTTEMVTAVASSFSIVSQRDADRKAKGTARLSAEGELICEVVSIYTNNNDEAFTTDNDSVLTD